MRHIDFSIYPENSSTPVPTIKNASSLKSKCEMRLTSDITSLELALPSSLSDRVVLSSQSFASSMLLIASFSSFNLMRNEVAMPLYAIELEFSK